MSLMERIKVRDFLSQTIEEKLIFIRTLQAKRINAIELSRLAPVRKSKKGAKIKKPKDPIEAALKALKKIKLTPSMINKIKESYGIK